MTAQLLHTLTIAIVVVVVVGASACGDSGGEPAPPTIEWTGSYARIVPGYDDEATCRANNPDPIFNCVELLSLCAEGRASALYTDIVSGGTWSDQGEHASVMLSDASFSMDGSFELAMDASGAVFSSEIYGDRAFARSDDPIDSLCP